MKMIPQVKFKIESFDEAFKTIIRYLSPNNRWNKNIFKVYPNLEKKLDGLKTWREVERTAKKFFREFYNKNLDEINKKTENYKKVWSECNDEFMLALEEILEIKWTKKFKIFTCRVGISPVCPRYLDKRMFDIYGFFNDELLRRLVSHELLHFLYFEKWKQVFPDYNKKKFEGPHLIWHLSEMVPKVILNDKKIKDIIKYESSVYPSYEKLKINDKPLLNYLQEIYDNKEDFADFLRKAYDFVKEHEKEIIKKSIIFSVI